LDFGIVLYLSIICFAEADDANAIGCFREAEDMQATLETAERDIAYFAVFVP